MDRIHKYRVTHIPFQSSKECSNNGGAKDMSPQTMTVMDLGKLLLHYTQTGETAKVQELMTRGAPFTTDWVITINWELTKRTNELFPAGNLSVTFRSSSQSQRYL